MSEDEALARSVARLMLPYATFSHAMANFAKEMRERATKLDAANPSRPVAFALVEAVEALMRSSGLSIDGKAALERPPAPNVTHYPVGNVTHADFSADRLLKHTRAAK